MPIRVAFGNDFPPKGRQAIIWNNDDHDHYRYNEIFAYNIFWQNKCNADWPTLSLSPVLIRLHMQERVIYHRHLIIATNPIIVINPRFW